MRGKGTTLGLALLLAVTLSQACWAAESSWQSDPPIDAAGYLTHPLQGTFQSLDGEDLPLMVGAGDTVDLRIKSRDGIDIGMTDQDTWNDPYLFEDECVYLYWQVLDKDAAVIAAYGTWLGNGSPWVEGMYQHQFTQADAARSPIRVEWHVDDYGCHENSLGRGDPNLPGSADDPNLSGSFVITVDASPPANLTVTDDGDFTISTTTLHAAWSAQDPESGIDSYRYGIGTSPGAVDVAGWTESGAATSATRTGLTLIPGQTYYFTVIAQNSVGLESQASSDGIKVMSPPLNVNFTPSTGTFAVGTKYTLTSVFSDADGYGDISSCYLLINTSFGGANASYMEYDAGDDKLYYRNDANTAWLGGITPGSPDVLENSYFKLYCAETTVARSGTNLTVNWKIEFKSGMSPKTHLAWQKVYDDEGLSDGWDQMGSDIVIDRVPTNVSLTPSSGLIPTGVKWTFSTKHSDPDGYANLKGCYLLINTAFGGTKATYVQYDANLNLLYLRDNANTIWGPGYAPGSANVLENSYCRLYCADTTVAGSGNELTVNWKIELKPTMAAKTQPCLAWMLTLDDASLRDDWEQMGSFNIFTDTTNPTNVSFTPNSGSLSPGRKQTFTSVHRDPDGYANLKDCLFLINNTSTGANATYVYYEANANLLHVRDNANTTWGTGSAPGSANVLENTYCKLYCAETTVSGSGTDLTINWSIELKSKMAEKGQPCSVWMRTVDDVGLMDDWEQMGALTIVVDTTPPPPNVWADQCVWSYTADGQQVYAVMHAWDDPESGIAEYQYCIGTIPGSDNVFPWTSNGDSTEVTITGLNLVDGQYHFGIRVRNGAGLWSVTQSTIFYADVDRVDLRFFGGNLMYCTEHI